MPIRVRGGVEFGYLPWVVMDRPVLRVDEGVLSRTPAGQFRGRDARVQIDVDADGSARYTYRAEDSGATAEPERNVFRRATRQRAQQIAADRLRQTGLHGTARMQVTEVDATGGAFTTSMDGKIEHFVWTKRHDGVTGSEQLCGRDCVAGAELACRASPDPAVCLHRRPTSPRLDRSSCRTRCR